MQLHVLDVGRSLSTIVKHDDNRLSVIDFGTNPSDPLLSTVAYLLNVLRSKERLLRFVLTNLAPVNIAGLFEFWKATSFYNFWHNDILPQATTSDDFDLRFLYDLILKRKDFGCNIVAVGAGYRTKLCSFEVLSPSQSLKVNSVGRQKDASLVIMGGTSNGDRILIVGDIGIDAWRELFSDKTTLDKLLSSDVVIFHGSVKDCQFLSEIISAISPKMIICNGVLAAPNSGVELLNMSELGKIILEDDSIALRVYVWDQNVALRKFGRLEKHRLYDAWLYDTFMR